MEGEATDMKATPETIVLGERTKAARERVTVGAAQRQVTRREEACSHAANIPQTHLCWSQPQLVI